MSAAAAADLLEQAHEYRGELLGYCYRFLGSSAEAEDAVQETLTRAWDKASTFRRESALRTWLYRIAVRVCLDMSRAPQRRALPMDLVGPGRLGASPPDLGEPLPADRWVWPMRDSRLLPPEADPAEVVAYRDSVRLAFLVALQHLPARQRAVLILRDVLAFSATETAQTLEISVDAVTSALARARSAIRGRVGEPGPAADDLVVRETVDRYVAAFEAYDVDALVRLLTSDADFTMPPLTFWLRGSEQIERWWRGPGEVCRGSRIVRTRLNGCPAVAAYHPAGPGRWDPFAVHVLEISAAGITAITHFLDAVAVPPASGASPWPVFAALDLPASLGQLEIFPGEQRPVS